LDWAGEAIWDSRKLAILFDNVEMVKSSHAVYGDIDRFAITSCRNRLKEYIFYSAWYDENREKQQVLSIEAEKWNQVGTGAEMNSVIFDVGYEYVGGQECSCQ